MSEGVDGGLTTYGDPGFSAFLRRAFLASAGYDGEDLDRPVVGIADTSSDFTTCHRQMPELVRAVGRGVIEGGAIPFVFPTMSLGEIFLAPTSMLYRNLMAMETEELIRSQPVDAVILLGGCDKTVPAQLMAAFSADKPFISVVTGPMETGSYRGERLGACTDCRRMWAGGRAGALDAEELINARNSLVSTAGTCTVMGTASTMACIAEGLGAMLPGGATPPAPTGARLRHAVESGRRAAELAIRGERPSQWVTESSFFNAARILMAVGGSTNALIHLPAIAHRAGFSTTLEALLAAAADVPLLVDVKPSGAGYMPDFHQAGGVPALMRELAPLLDLSARGVSGVALADLIDQTPEVGTWQTTIRPLSDPLGPPGSLVVLHGNLAPDGAVMKVSAASPELLVHRGRAIVFESPADVDRRLDSIEIDPTDVLVLRNIGPVGAGMPEAGSIPIPRALAKRGIKDMVRVSDGRMSGTAFGTIVLHVSPESAVGGPLALVRDGDFIELDAPGGRLELVVDARELERRRAKWTPPPLPPRGWSRLYAGTVQQSHQGADLEFLVSRPPPELGEQGLL